MTTRIFATASILLGVASTFVLGDSTDSWEYRLVAEHASKPMRGRFEMRPSDVDAWGTVCSDDFDDFSARVACKAIGMATDKAYVIENFGQANVSAPIYLDNVQCGNGTASLANCSYLYSPPGQVLHNCQHWQDVGIDCTGTGRPWYPPTAFTALTDKNATGLVEKLASWFYVGADRFVVSDDNVTNGTAGFSYVSFHVIDVDHDDTSYYFTRDLIEKGLLDATAATRQQFLAIYSLASNTSAAVKATMAFRLVDGDDAADNGTTSASVGRLEVRPDDYSAWGTMCDDGFDANAANAVCHSLGFPLGGYVNNKAVTGAVKSPEFELHTYAYDIDCKSDDEYFQNCSFTYSAVDRRLGTCRGNNSVVLSCGTPTNATDVTNETNSAANETATATDMPTNSSVTNETNETNTTAVDGNATTTSVSTTNDTTNDAANVTTEEPNATTTTPANTTTTAVPANETAGTDATNTSVTTTAENITATTSVTATNATETSVTDANTTVAPTTLPTTTTTTPAPTRAPSGIFVATLSNSSGGNATTLPSEITTTTAAPQPTTMTSEAVTTTTAAEGTTTTTILPPPATTTTTGVTTATSDNNTAATTTGNATVTTAYNVTVTSDNDTATADIATTTSATVTATASANDTTTTATSDNVTEASDNTTTASTTADNNVTTAVSDNATTATDNSTATAANVTALRMSSLFGGEEGNVGDDSDAPAAFKALLVNFLGIDSTCYEAVSYTTYNRTVQFRFVDGGHCEEDPSAIAARLNDAWAKEHDRIAAAVGIETLSAPAPSDDGEGGDDDDNDDVAIGVGVGVGVGVPVLLLAIGAVILVCKRRRTPNVVKDDDSHDNDLIAMNDYRQVDQVSISLAP